MTKVNNSHNFPPGFHDYLNLPLFPQDMSYISAVNDALKVCEEHHRSLTQLTQSSVLVDTIEHNIDKLNPFDQMSLVSFSTIKFIGQIQNSSPANLMQQVRLSTAWHNEYQNVIAITDVTAQPYSELLESYLSEISKLSSLSQISLSHLATEYVVGDALKVDCFTQNSLNRLVEAYARLFASFDNTVASIISFSPAILRCSAIEIFNGARVVEVFTVDSGEIEPNEILEKEIHHVEENIWKESEKSLEELLKILDTQLISLLDGARQSLESTNPDRIRHFSASLRELFTHVMHKLAPDEDVKNWSSSPAHYDNGRPTRRARLLYICRSWNREPFSDFLEKDVEAATKLLTLFQKGTHGVSPNFTDDQLRVMLVRMECTLRFLLVIWRETNIT